MATRTASTESSRQSAERTPPETLVELVETGLRYGRTPDQLADELADLERRGEIRRAPGGRTIRNWIMAGKVRRPPRPTDPWTVLSGKPEDVALVLPVIPLVAALPRHARWLSIREAEVVARVRRAAPVIEPAQALTLASLYVERERTNKPTTDLDLYLAFAVPADMEDATEIEQYLQKYEETARAAGLPRLMLSTRVPGLWHALTPEQEG